MQEAVEVQTELLRTQLFESNGCVVGKAVVLRPSHGFPASFLTSLVSSSSLGGELEKLSYRLCKLLDYVEAHIASLMEHLDIASCCIWDIVDFGVHRGAAIALLMGEICSGAVSRTCRAFGRRAGRPDRGF